jgi:hypothetical protein
MSHVLITTRVLGEFIMYTGIINPIFGALVCLGIFLFFSGNAIFALKRGYTPSLFNRKNNLPKFLHYLKSYVQIIIGFFAIFFLISPSLNFSKDDAFTYQMAFKKAVQFIKDSKYDSIGINLERIEINPWTDRKIKTINKSNAFYSKKYLTALDTNAYYYQSDLSEKYLSWHSYKIVFLEREYKSIYDGIVLSVNKWSEPDLKRIQSFTNNETDGSDNLSVAHRNHRALFSKSKYQVKFEINVMDSINFLSFETKKLSEIKILKNIIREMKYKSTKDFYGNNISEVYKKTIHIW